LGKHYQKTGPTVWFCLSILFAGNVHGRCRTTLARSASEGHKRRVSSQLLPCSRCGLVLPMRSQNEEFSHLSLTQTAWQMGWFFVDGTRADVDCFVFNEPVVATTQASLHGYVFHCAGDPQPVQKRLLPVNDTMARGRLSVGVCCRTRDAGKAEASPVGRTLRDGCQVAATTELGEDAYKRTI